MAKMREFFCFFFKEKHKEHKNVLQASFKDSNRTDTKEG